jgi:hypothetical protein
LIGPEPAGRGGDFAVAADGQHIPDTAGLQLGAQTGIGAVDLVTGHPAGLHTGIQRPDHHRGGQRRFGRELDVGGDPGRGPPVGIVGPGLGKV